MAVARHALVTPILAGKTALAETAATAMAAAVAAKAAVAAEKSAEQAKNQIVAKSKMSKAEKTQAKKEKARLLPLQCTWPRADASCAPHLRRRAGQGVQQCRHRGTQESCQELGALELRVWGGHDTGGSLFAPLACVHST